MKTVLFDLDGTLINSKTGVTRCAQYALSAFGIEEETDKLDFFIGPPLEESFIKRYGFSEEKAREAVKKFRERYQPVGIYECELYPGVEETLKRITDHGYRIALSSSKAEVSCVQLMEHFHLKSYFDVIAGATLDGKIGSKISVLRETMRRLGQCDTKSMVLIGDTRFDVLGANEAGIDCVGVTYGFGSREELLESGAVAVCGSMKEVGDYIVDKF